jgi:hypothetical protein
MPNYDFNKDLPIARKTEEEVAGLLLKNNGDKIKEIIHNDDNKYDLKVVLKNGESITVEVKEDFTCERTSNVGVEYECRGKPSGIATSRADLYMYKIHEPSGTISFYLLDTKDLKTAIREKKYFRQVSGGDAGSDSKNFLFKLDVFKKIGKKFF